MSALPASANRCILRSSRVVRCRNYAAAGPPPARKSSSSATSSTLYAAGLFGAVIGGAVLLSSFGNKDNRAAAIKKLDTSKISAKTPAAVVAKADQARSQIPVSPSSSSSQSSDDAPSSTSEFSSSASESVEQQSDSESAEQSAFNPETGEINWDCPCLGGMANGPCGEEFKEAFSCFVFSTEDPKGIDCVDKFKAMQECFRKYPEHYGDELAEDEEDSTSSLSASISESISETAQSAKESLSDLASEAASVISLSDSESSSSSSSSSSSKIRDQGAQRQPPYSHEPSQAHSNASGSGGHVDGEHSLHPEKTTNMTGGKKDPLGRNAAKGEKASGSEKAHALHQEGVKQTRSGTNAEGDRSGGAMRG